MWEKPIKRSCHLLAINNFQNNRFCQFQVFSIALTLLLIFQPIVLADNNSSLPLEKENPGAVYRCGVEQPEATKKQPLWVSRCYNGKVSLKNYDSLASKTARAESNLFWGIMQKFAGFQEADYSGQFIDARQSLALIFFLMSGGHLGWAHDVSGFTRDIRQTGPVVQGIGFDTHQRVQIYYSDGVINWLKNNRQGEIPNGAIIVKQMYSSNPVDRLYGADRTTGWAVMVRNNKLSKDGWIWYLFFFPKAPPYNAPIPVAYGQTGDNFCLSCHAAADNDQVTFAALSNLEGAPQQYTWVDHTFPGLFNIDDSKASTPRFNQGALQSFASGISHFQQLGISGLPLLKSLSQEHVEHFMGDFEKTLEHLDEMTHEQKKEFIKKLTHKLMPEVEQLIAPQQNGGKTNSAETINERLPELFEKLLAELKQAEQKGQYEAFLEQVMQTYLRLLTQAQPVTPLNQANPDILIAFEKQSKVELKKREADLDWLPLDFIFSHTPSLPEKLPENICQIHQQADIIGLENSDANIDKNSGDLSDCRDTFITSDNCNGCHWSYVLQGQAFPNMLTVDLADQKTPPNKQKLWDISPYAEWSASMMGLAGKDPIFNAQLGWEQENKPELAEQISNFCLRCHQAGAQRQFHLDHADNKDPAVLVPPDEPIPGPLFSADYLFLQPKSTIDKSTKWGALGRDGITCTVCHQIEKQGLGEKETFTGQFHFPDKPGQVFGPYTNNKIKSYLMEQAIGIKPVYGEHIQESALCGSCHTVITPIVSEPPKKGAYRSGYEQTTYPEWLNSDFSAQGGQSCQECHMPSRLPNDSQGTPMSLSEIIANVETAYLPRLDNRAADELITPTEKANYRRHTLVGMNMFANQMFQQFPNSLGNSSVNPGGMPNARPPLLLAQKEMEYFAQQATLNLEIKNATQAKQKNYQFDVSVENLVGHKFPSGVGFRRAFIEFKAIDANGYLIWASGSTNSIGQIINLTGDVLASEMSTDPLAIPNGATSISSSDEVYIFEERTVTWNDGEQRDPGEDSPPLEQMLLTTSFLEIVGEAKDTRLLPKGWKKNGPYAEHTGLSTIDQKNKQVVPYYPTKPGYRTISYKIPKNVGDIAKVKAIVHYQSIPPYYIQDRLQFNTQAAQRLYYMIAHLRTKGTPIENWTINLIEKELSLKNTF